LKNRQRNSKKNSKQADENDSAPLGNPSEALFFQNRELNYCSAFLAQQDFPAAAPEVQQAFFSEVVQAADFFVAASLSSVEMVAAAVVADGGATFTKVFVFSSY
jgi:hypothetical protein